MLDNRIGKLCKLAQCNDIFDYYVEVVSIFSEQPVLSIFHIFPGNFRAGVNFFTLPPLHAGGGWERGIEPKGGGD